MPNGWSKRLAELHGQAVEFDILYRLLPYQQSVVPLAPHGNRVTRFFIVTNDTEHKLGTTPLPDGLVRTFRDNGRDGLAFLGQQKIAYVPIKADMELNLGPDDDVVERLKVMKVERSNFSFDRNRHVNGWDGSRDCRDEIQNHSAKPVRVEVRRVLPGDVELTSETARLHDYRTVEFTVDVKAATTLTWDYHYVEHLGANAKQNQIRLK